MPRSARARVAVLVALALGAGAALGQAAPDGGPAVALDGGAAEGPDGGPSPHRAFAGTVTAVDFASQRLTVEWAGRPVTMTFDRNTQVYLQERLGSLRDLTAGAEVRAARGPTGLAIWVELLRGAAALSGAPSDGGQPAEPDGGATRPPSPPAGVADGGPSAPPAPSGSRP